MAGSHDSSLRIAIREARRAGETVCLRERLEQARLEPNREQLVQDRARRLAAHAREHALRRTGLEAFLQEYDLSSPEGVLLMCIAEALLRIPDTQTADRLIHDRLSRGQWDDHLGTSSSLLVNASSWGLLLTGRLFTLPDTVQSGPEQLLRRLVARAGEPVVRLALQTSMQMLAQQFVMGRTIQEAVQRAGRQAPGLRYSYDCLGEAAHTAEDVTRYLGAYREAIHYMGEATRSDSLLSEQAGISVKLSALHSRYEYSQRERVLRELLPRVQLLIEDAVAAGIGLTLDAEEADDLELSLDLFEHLVTDLRDCSWQGLGLAVQAYQKCAWSVLQWLRHLAHKHKRHFPIRLVKGAYWDSEIKRAQEGGLDSYPVFTRKSATDVSYLACARFLMRNTDRFYPQIASHNALTLAWVNEIGQGRDYELQRLHGMGDSLFQALPEYFDDMPPVRIYAPVGSHEELLPYLVRRLLENGANSSFINQLTDEQTALDELVENPCDHIDNVGCQPHPDIPLPAALYGDERHNARGWDLSDPDVISRFNEQVSQICSETWHAAACVGGEELRGEGRPLMNPADSGRTVGDVVEADTETVDRALAIATDAAPGWNGVGGSQRARYLYKTADLFEARVTELVARLVYEAGRTLRDAVSEVREAVDFCRYYAFRAEQEFASAMALPGPTGERNELQLHGRGVFACISPWNFPLAIFVGQIAAALAAGNTVLAKPARQTPLTGYQAIRLMYEAGVPTEVLHFLPGSGAVTGRRLCADQRLGGVAFTGSTDTAWDIQRALADRRGPIVPLIAETGGQNVMIADSSALPEQLVVDVLDSAFNSAGQRCSALRVLFVQDEIADAVISRLTGAMEELAIGNPVHLATDVGPLIDQQAIQVLQPHVGHMRREARLLQCIEPGPHLAAGCFFPLYAFELESLDLLDKEEFGPILHVIRYQGDRLDKVIEAVNATGYGLTLGVHSRVETTWKQVQASARVGNLYINRNMIGAVVGAQPFGGEGLSGTGPKAGGPYYLHRFATERTLSVNTAAVGGNTGLLSMRED
ncbi:MAG: bifunctional proline dehydrogenase/L-glutamate gamma-semialdehyde dehydrogenase PutA [Gammaproteobacteria bacterium]|nr:MAG: bifunctional proline dehydrogenase/L-glutamate gamma-semialdehyde dehydrogenase PutA [Gammaproteobacteria bacterium]